MAKDVEAYINELKAIADKLSGDDVKLGDAVELYKQGATAAAQAEKMLNQYEKEIEIINTGESEIN